MSNNDYENERNENVSGDLEKNNEPLTDEASTIDNNRSEQNRTTDEKQQTYVASSETNPPKQKKIERLVPRFLAEQLEELFLPYLLSCS